MHASRFVIQSCIYIKSTMQMIKLLFNFNSLISCLESKLGLEKSIKGLKLAPGRTSI